MQVALVTLKREAKKETQHKGNTMKQIKHSDVVKGEQVTTHGTHGSTGIGYLIDGVVYKTTGSYWAIDAKADVFPMQSFDRDNGRGYLNKIKNMGLSHYTTG